MRDRRHELAVPGDHLAAMHRERRHSLHDLAITFAYCCQGHETLKDFPTARCLHELGAVAARLGVCLPFPFHCGLRWNFVNRMTVAWVVAFAGVVGVMSAYAEPVKTQLDGASGAALLPREIRADDFRPGKAADAEAELQDIARTKALMKALSGADNVKAGEPAAKASGNPQPVVNKPAGVGSAASETLLDPKMLGEMRAIAKEGAAAVKAVGSAVGMPSAEATASSPSTRADFGGASAGERSDGEGGRRPVRQADEDEFRVLLEGLIDEIKPWFFAAMFLLALGVTARAWLLPRLATNGRPGGRRASGRSSRTDRSGRHRSRSRQPHA